ncbi:transglycosylase SLT domain-containing protein [Melissococcus plutonius]|uniref:transglycosylase SLT domain-containing protein n=2 Tax=Melissococcus plutonius TaxID=33970 RepID=UPI0021E5E982|nr:transglycosylase SLT domain-containing protein [Melissococcus plutonius]MCV2528114.1 transglycosylase SLT domain-containing protein [Melissococcus plutonius]
MEKKPKLNLDGAIKKLEDLNAKAEGTHHMFGKIMGAELISRAAIAGLQNLKSGLTDALKAGMEFNEEQQVMSATWNTLTNDAGKAQGMVKTINDLSVATGRSRDLVNELEQGFYHLHSDKKESDNLTKSMLNMGDAVGLTDDKIQTVTQDMVHGLSSGKLSLQELNQLGQYFPMFTEQMAAYVQKHKQATDDSSKDSKEAAKAQKAYVKEMTAQFEAMHYGSKISQQDIQTLGQKSILSGDQVKKFTEMQQQGQTITTSMIKQAIRVNSEYAKSTTDSKQQVAESSDDAVKHLRDLVHQGKVSATEVEDVFNHLGQDKYGKAADNMLQTMSGMKRTVASQVPALVGAFEKPILNAKNPFYGAVSKWVSDQKTQDKFTKMGEAAQKGVDTILKAFGKVFAKGSTVNIADGLLDWITQKITDMSNWIANHANQIVDFFKKTKDVVVDLFNRGKETLSGFYDIAKPFLDLIKKYPKQFGELIGAMYLAKPAIEGVTIALKGFQMFKIASDWVGSLANGLKLLGKTNLPGAGGKGLGLAEEAESAGKIAGSLGESAGWLTKIGGKAVPITAGISSLMELKGMTKDTAGEHIGGAVGNFGGAMGGAAIGSAILPGVGTLTGGVIGAMGGSAIGKKLGKSIGDGFKHYAPDLSNHLGDMWDGITKNMHKNTSVNARNLSKDYTDEIKKLNQLTIKTPKTDKDLKDQQTQTQKTFAAMSSSIKGYYYKKEKSSKADYDYFVKNGLMTRKEADKQLKAQTDKDETQKTSHAKVLNDMQNDATSHYTKLQKIESGGTDGLQKVEKQYGKNSKQYKKELNKELEDEQKDYTKKISANEAKLNSQITAETKIASGKQLDILQNLKNHKGKLSLEDAKSAILNSKKQRDKLIGDAKKTANGAIDAADKKYNETVKKADKERFENGTMSKKQYDEVIKNAKQQRDDAVKAAEKTKNKSIKHATDTHEQVVKQAEKQAGEHKGSLDKETGYVKGSTEDQTSKYYDSIDASIDMINWIWGLFSNNKKKFSHISRKSLTGHKDGLFDVTHGEIAIVGEEGMELAHHPNKGIYPVGVNGEEVRYLEPNTSILPHEQSKQFLSMAQGLPHYKKGKGNFIDDLLDGAKGMVGKITSEAKNVWKIISGSAEKAWEFLAKKFSINDKFKQIQSKGELSKAGGGLVAHESKSAVTEMLSKMIGKVKSLFDSDANAPTSGPPGAGVERWKDLVKKALDANGLSTSGAMIDKVLRQIQTESSGNPNAKQPGADPDGDGSGPALGLMQTKRSTFDAYKFPGHGNIFDGYDNLLAALKYAKARYGSDLSFLGQGHGYANGGWADKPSIFGEVKNEPEVAINPKRSTADHLIIEAMQARAKMAPNSLSADMVQMMTNTKTLPLHAGMQSVAMLYKAKENLDTSTHNVQPANSDQSELIALAKGQLRELTEQNTFLRKILDAVLTTDNNNNNNNNSGYHVLLKQMQKDQALNAWQY